MNYSEAERTLNGRDSRKIGNNTYLQRRDEHSIAIKLHDTDILTFHPSSTTYNSGGWRTVTTKARLNEHGSPARVFSSKGEWTLTLNGESYAFADGLTIHESGRVTGFDKNTASRDKERERIKRYAHDYIVALQAGKVPAPSNGDCWGCLFVADNGRINPMGVDHLREHMREKYYVPSLIQRAFEALGASQTMKWWIGSYWAGKPVPFDEHVRAEKTLRRFMLRSLGHGT